MTIHTQEQPETPYDLIGGEEGVRRLVDRFYDIMDTDPVAARIRAMHGANLEPMREKLTQYLSGWFGGPALYFQRKDAKCVMSAHSPFAIGEAEANQWMHCIHGALKEAPISEILRAQMDEAFTRFAEALRKH